MSNFTEVVRWNSATILRDNLTYGLERPALENIDVVQEGLSVIQGDVFGKATYRYDFGRYGLVTAFQFDGMGLLKFRIKTAGSSNDLDHAEFFGTEVDRFPGTTIDLVKYTVTPNVLGVGEGIISAAGIATVTYTTHPFVSGDIVSISGVTQTEYNGSFTITKTGANTFTYVILGVPTSPAIGNIKVGAYSVTQSNGLMMTGPQVGSGLFTNPARMTLNIPLSDTYSIKSYARLLVGDPIYHTGSFTFLELDDGINNIQVQKYLAQIRTHIVDKSGQDLGRDVDNNDIVLGETTDIEINDVHTEYTDILTDGLYGRINDQIVSPTVVDEFKYPDNPLKNVKELTNFFGRTPLGEDYIRILGIRADYSLTGILADMQRGLFYRPYRINGYYALRVPLVDSEVDLFANKITSYNLVSGKYTYAEVNDVWATTILIPAGIHYYRFLVDGIVQLDSANPNSIQIATGAYSVIAVESTQFVDFVYRGKAGKVFLVGSFNSFSETANPLAVGFDPSEVLKINLGNTYFNDHSDWHKIEVEFENPVPIVGIRFLSDVPFAHKQRVKVLLDDIPITREEWEIGCSPEGVLPPGVSECATYSNMLASNFEGECKSYFINGTDTVTASEDGWVEWRFIMSQPVNDRFPNYCKKFAFLTRLENGAIFNRSHRGLEISVPTNFVARVTDYLISDNELEFRTTRQTEVGLNGTWNIPQVVLQNGINAITPIQMLGNTSVSGDSIVITRNTLYSFIEQIDQSGVSLNNVEIAYTRAAGLTQELESIIEVQDLGGTSGGGGGGEPRFTREAFTRANDTLRVVIINVDIVPARVFYLHLIGGPVDFSHPNGYFLFELYETEEDARNRINRIGYAESIGYGFQVLPPFIVERTIETLSGPMSVTVENIIVCFDQYAANTIFVNRPRANV